MIGQQQPTVWKARLEQIAAAIEQNVQRGDYFGAVIRVARGGEVVLSRAIGYEDAAKTRPLREDSIFSIFSITKAFVNVLVLRAIEEGRLTLTTRISAIIPEFAGVPRERITVYHLLTHTAGLPGVWSLGPDVLVDRFDEVLRVACATIHSIVEPGTRCDYSPMVNHILMAEALRRLDPRGRAIRDILREELFEPLGMSDTSLGVRRDLAARHVVPDMRGTLPIRTPGRNKPGPYGVFEEEEAEMPWAGAVATASNLHRFVEMLRRGGELDGARIVSPTTLRLARRNWTGDMPNELYRAVALRAGWEVPPAYIGLGFSVRGERIVHHQFGTLTSPQTFGNYGSGSAVYWVDPELDVSFVCLTAGLLSQAANIERFQRLSDMTVSAML